MSNELAEIFGRVRAARGIDFTLYRRSTIERRTLGRMRLAGASDYRSYLDLLARDPDEMSRLVAYLTIKVGRFFRDQHVFSVVSERVLPALRRQRRNRPLAIWSAGCGNGEETYSLALLLAESEPVGSGSFVVGSDVDDAALAVARAGHYRREALADVPPDQVERYFGLKATRRGHMRVVGDALRRRTRFVNHNLGTALAAPGEPPYDLILCRNVLIYFGPALQERAERLLLQSLAPGGVLCLGEAEWPLPEIQRQLAVEDRQARLFRLKESSAKGGAE